MIAVGSTELGNELGETVMCPHCGAQHAVEYGERILPDGTRQPSRLLAFCKCPANGTAYIVGLDGREILHNVTASQGDLL